MAAYAQYLLYESEYSSYFSGSLEGFLFEWTVHNVAFELASTPEDEARAKDLDVGRTIYADSHGWKTQMMLYAYELLYPEQAKSDFWIQFSQ